MIFIVYGTRAELIKFSPLIRELKRRKADFKLVDTGQHDNHSLQMALKLPEPDFHLGKSYRLRWSSLETNAITYPMASMLALFWGFKVFAKLAMIFSGGDVIVTHGNAMGVPLSIYAAKLSSRKPNIVHMESGFRAGRGNARLLDFIYRFADKRSDYLFTPFKSAEKNLRRERVAGRIILSGDVMKDVVAETLRLGGKSRKTTGRYVVANMTRSIVDKNGAKHVLNALAESPVKVILILNPVIKKRIEKFGLSGMLKSGNIGQAPTMNYPDFLRLLNGSVGAVTDSTGVQEECAVMGKPCIVTNDFLQIPELQSSGAVRLTGTNYIGILDGLRKMASGRWKVRSKKLFQAGSPTKKIADHLVSLDRRSK